ncbi:MAG: hypothetical protein QOK37_180 [Thermoanaerobaculia bacterium]|jgi:hypothetical protein|nr:hypothetical protein [Thermoanaerobaculia bacterium]
MAANSKSPFFLAGCGCLSFIAAMILFVAAYLINDSKLSGYKSESSPDDFVVYRNTRDGRTGPLAENYVGFEFRYPKSWVLKPQDSGSSNFVTVERAVDGKTYENLNVGYFATAGSTARNRLLYPQMIAQLQSQFEQQFRDLKKVQEGATRIGDYDAWEALFTSTTSAGDKVVTIYTRAVLLPTPDGSKGVSILMMGTSNSPDLSSAEDLGHKGELPAVLESFKFQE